MADTVIVQTTASSAGAPVAVEALGGADYQLVKLVAGQSGISTPIAATTGTPAAGSMGMVVVVKDGASVSAQVSGTVSISGIIPLSGTVTITPTILTVNTAATVAGASVTIQQGASVSAQVSGTVSISPTILTVNTAATIAGASVTAQVSGTVSLSALPAISGTVTISPTILTVNTAATIAGASVTAQVSGTVSISGTAVVSLATGGTLATLLGTVAVNVVAGGAGGGSVTTLPPSITATGQLVWIVGGQGTTANPVVVTGTVAAGAGTTVVSIAGIVAVTTQASVSVSGLPVWMNPTQSVAVGVVSVTGVSLNVVVSGAVSVSAMPAVSVSVSAVLGTVVTLLGTINANVVAGSVAFSTTAIATTTATSGVTGAIVWLGVSQVLNVVNTVVTQLGTQVVSVVPGVSVNLGSLATVVGTTTATSGVTGPIVWLGVNQTMSALNTVVTVLGTQIVSVVPGVSVGITVSAALGTVITILGTQIVSVVPGVSVGITVSAALGTVITILGTQVVSVVPGLSVSGVVSGTVSILSIAGVTTAASVSVTGLPVWLNPTQTIAISGAILGVLTQTTVGVTGALVYLAQSQTMSQVPYTPFLMAVSSTAGISAGTTLLMTIWTGISQAGAALTQFAVPSGKTLRIMNMQAVVNQSGIGVGTIQIIVNAATASASLTSANQATIGRPAMLEVNQLVAATGGSIMELYADVPAGATLGIFATMATSINIGNVIMAGYLF